MLGVKLLRPWDIFSPKMNKISALRMIPMEVTETLEYAIISSYSSKLKKIVEQLIKIVCYDIWRLSFDE